MHSGRRSSPASLSDDRVAHPARARLDLGSLLLAPAATLASSVPSEPASALWPITVRQDGGRLPAVEMSAAPAARTRPFNGRTRIVKRLLDVVVAATCLIIIAPLLVVIAVVILCDSPGPVLFRQRRVGKDGSTFIMLKFRTMGPDRRKQSLGPPAIGDRRRLHKSPNDPRVTRVGRFLRRSCLDELPQLWNVLQGDMSLVGPRPELPEIVERYEPWQHQRHVVRPGITGWWQVNRDGVRPMHEATELDLWYIDHWSLRLDLQILVRTLRVAFGGLGAF